MGETAHACPTCNGHGTTNKPPWVAGDQMTWSSHNTAIYPCKACGGTGVLWRPNPKEDEECAPDVMR